MMHPLFRNNRQRRIKTASCLLKNLSMLRQSLIQMRVYLFWKISRYMGTQALSALFDRDYVASYEFVLLICIVTFRQSTSWLTLTEFYAFMFSSRWILFLLLASFGRNSNCKIGKRIKIRIVKQS